MRRDQVSPARQSLLVPAQDHPHVLALVAPPTPRELPDATRHADRFARAHAALGRLQGAMEHLPNADLVTRTLARREAVKSSQIEGTRATLPELLAYEATRGAGGLAAADVRVTERYVEALQLGLERIRQDGRKALDLALVNELHAALMRDEAGRFTVGGWRTAQVFIGGGTRIEDASFVPAPPDRIQACMDEFAEAALQYAPREDEHMQLPLVAQLLIAHAQFETIHPYHDGNGRTGRLLIPLLLAAEDYPPLYVSGVLLRAREQYYAALLAVQLRGDWGPWIELLCAAIVEACTESESIARDLLALCAQWDAQLANYRQGSATRRLPALLVGYPVLSVQQAMHLLGVSQPAANAALNNLLAAGIVSLVNERQWGRVFQATAVLERLDRPPA